MKVLHVIDSLAFGGGAEESLVGMLPRLRERGIDGHVVCLYDRHGYQDDLKFKGFQVDVLRKTSLLGQARAVREIIRATGPDLVHASLVDACLATRLAMLGLPHPQLNSLVNTTYDPVRVSDLQLAPWKMFLLKMTDRVTSRWVNGGFHALSEAVKTEAVEVLGIPAQKVWVIPRGRDSDEMGRPGPVRRQVVRDSLGVGDDQVLILNVGRQEPQKAKTLLVEAFARISPKHPNAGLIIAGKEGRDTPRLHSAIEASAMTDRIRVLGHRTDVPDLLAAADMFVFPSHYEGLGGALVEAMCMGCPVIGSDAPAIAEVLGYGAHGIVVPRGDVEALAGAMSELVGSRELRQHWARRSRRHFESQFELDGVIDRMAALYRRFLE